MQKTSHFFLKLAAFFILMPVQAFASDHGDVSPKSYDLTGLYIFRPTTYVDEATPSPTPAPAPTPKYVPHVTNTENLVIVLNLAPHEGFVGNFSVFSRDAKYSIYVSNDGDEVADFHVDVFFGSDEQYAFYIDNASEPILGKIGERAVFNNISVFAGRRADPESFDRKAFDTLFTDGCNPVLGLRCEGSPVNTYGKSNVGSIAIELPIIKLTGLATPDQGKLRIWAKSFKVD